MTLNIVAVLLMMIAVNPGPENCKALSPLEVIANAEELLESEPIHVSFRIGLVDTVPTTRADGTRFQQVRLHPDTNFNRSLRASFYVTLAEPVESTFKRIGITDLERHFKGKQIEVTGGLSRSGLLLRGIEEIWFYYVNISDLKQIRAVKQ